MKFEIDKEPYKTNYYFSGKVFLDDQDEHKEYTFYIDWEDYPELEWEDEIPAGADDLEILILESFQKQVEG